MIQKAAPEARQLFTLGFLTLFLELVLIRFLSGNIWNLGYFPNFVLIGVFVGMGGGFVSHARGLREHSLRRFYGAPWVLLLLVAFVILFHPAIPGFKGWEGSLGGELYFTSTSPANEANLKTPLSFACWFAGIVAIFFLISQRTACLFRKFSPLRAYTLDITGSLCGIATFFCLSWYQIPAPLWFLILVPLFIGAAAPISWKQAAILCVPLFLAMGFCAYQDTRLVADSTFAGRLRVFWSPYQKIEWTSHPDAVRPGVNDGIFANGVAHQGMSSPRLEPNSLYHEVYKDRRKHPGLPAYRRVLILGSGTGNDVSAALANGAERIDAVEIDPVVARIGGLAHPDHPYRNPRVHLIIDDGRAFMNRAKEPYDLIIFALTDSLVKVSAVAQLRLENYLFTREAVAKAKALLTEDGDLCFYNFYRRPWIEFKIKQMVHEVSGEFPEVIHRQNDFAILLAGKHHRAEAGVMETVDTPTDDWPFFYLKTRSFPLHYALALAVILCGALGFLLYVDRRRDRAREISPLRIRLAFFLMGAAFLLLETKSVVQFSLLFGTTWINASFVFAAVLALVLLANLLAERLTWLAPAWVFTLLILSSLLSLAWPLESLLSIETLLLRAAAAGLVVLLPIFFANLLFSLVFRDVAVAEHLFGWNLMGATLGGILEYGAMLTGYRVLGVAVVAFYGIAFLLIRQRSALGQRSLSVHR